MEFRTQFILMMIVLICAIVSIIGFCFTGVVSGFSFIVAQISIIFLALTVVLQGFES